MDNQVATNFKQTRLRSFVRRDSRITASQARAQKDYWPQFGLDLKNGHINFNAIFNNTQPTFLEIGFGTGQSLLAAAELHADRNFIGVETHKPGIGALLLGASEKKLTNLRVYYSDVIDVLENCIPENSLAGVQIFFPDPWQKRRHHPRRLIQADFIKLVTSKLVLGGSLHLATDWDDYSTHMMCVLSSANNLVNEAGINQFAPRSVYRPILSKFEKRAEREGRRIWELQFQKLKHACQAL